MGPTVKLTLGSVDQISQYKLKLEVSKKFGNDGLKVYGLLEKSTDFEYIEKNAGLEDERLYRILAFMAKLGLVKAEGLPAKYTDESPISEGLMVGVLPAESLMRFRHQKALFKSFSSVGIKVYEYVRGNESTFDKISRDLGIEPDKVKEILDFMIANDIAYSKQMGPVKKPEEPKPPVEEVKVKKEAPKEEEIPEELPPEGIEEKIAPSEEEKPAAKKKKAEKPKKKEEEGPLPEIDERMEYRIADLPLSDKYHIQKEVLDRFGSDGLKVYSLFTISANALKVAELSGLDIGKVRQVAGYLVLKNYLIEVGLVEEAKPPAKKEERAPPPARRKIEEEEELAPEEEEISPPEEEEEIRPPMKKKVVEEEEERPSPARKKEEEKPAQKKEEKKPFKRKAVEEEELRPVEEEIKPMEEAEEKEEEKEYVPPEEKEEKEEEEEKPEEEVAPPEEEEEEEKPVEGEEIARPEEEEEEKEEIMPPEEEEEKPSEEEEIAGPAAEEEEEKPAGEEEETPSEGEEKKEGELSQFEKIINDAYGAKGLQVYKLIDGRRTAEEIMKEADVDEEFIIDFFGFLENKGIIRLEKPKGEGKPVEEETEKGEERPGGEGFAAQPLTEGIEIPKKEIIILDMVPLDVPILNKLSLPARMTLEAKLLAKFGPKSLRILGKINNESDVTKIAIENAINIDELDEMLYSISNGGGCTFATLSEEDVDRRYGDEALEIYKKYGRDGILIYELIGKMDSIKKMVDFAKIDPKKAVEIILEINKLLGIEGVTKKDLYAELGLRE